MSDETSTTTINVQGLDKLLKALKQAKPPKARVGIMGSKAGPRTAVVTHAQLSRKGSVSTNAEVGAAHEYGAPARGIPQRSFLRVPLADRLGKEMEASGALDESVTKEVLKQGTVVPYLKKIVILAERIVIGAFATAGYGKWAAWKNPNYSNNANQILVDTQQLRNSITSEVVDNG